MVLAVAFAVGDCASFGGRCPAEPEPLLDDDVFRIAAIGGALLVAPPLLLARRRWYVVVSATALAAVVLGLVARAATTG